MRYNRRERERGRERESVIDFCGLQDMSSIGLIRSPIHMCAIVLKMKVTNRVPIGFCPIESVTLFEL